MATKMLYLVTASDLQPNGSKFESYQGIDSEQTTNSTLLTELSRSERESRIERLRAFELSDAPI